MFVDIRVHPTYFRTTEYSNNDYGHVYLNNKKKTLKKTTYGGHALQ